MVGLSKPARVLARRRARAGRELQPDLIGLKCGGSGGGGGEDEAMRAARDEDAKRRTSEGEVTEGRDGERERKTLEERGNGERGSSRSE